ncbi:MAG: AMP-binding protein [Methanomassiliicoccaceae archaeon]|jgi:acetyl-CoA synthetase|nr:AMP-binding protein [Methanomassiliicoccaceae archaeon]
MRNINLRYIDEEFDEDGILTKLRVHYPDNFNFGYDIVDDIGTHDPDRRALVWVGEEGNTRTLTFRDIMVYSNKAANYLMSLGVKKGDSVIVTLKENYQYWYVSVALHKIGAVLIPVTSMLTTHDAEYRANLSSAKAIICTSYGKVTDAFEGIEIKCPDVKVKAMCGGERNGWLDFDAGVEAASDKLERIPTKATDHFLIYFSSGTTGYPKMVLHDHTYPLGHILTAKHWHNVDPEGVHFTIAETGWAKASWGKIYGQWIMEAAIFVYDFAKFTPADILSKIAEFNITTLCCPPTMFRFFIQEGLEKFDLSTLKHTTIAGEPLNPDVFNNWYKATGLKLAEGFGQTETTPLICNTTKMEPRPGSMGKPCPQYEIDIINPDGTSCKPGYSGEVVVRVDNNPPGIFREYYLDEKKTKATIFDGYHHTGDIAWKDEEGYYWYVGRNDDIIKSSGYRIGPFEIESVVLTHPAVKECAVTGVPDEIRGQLVKATIVLKPGYEPSDDLKKEIQNFVKKETAPYKYPRVIDFVPALPKTISGKIKRMDIRKGDL